MAELVINPEDVSKALRSLVEDYEPELEREEVGRVLETGDGIAHVSGLPGCMANELLDFGEGVTGIAMNLDEDTIGVVVLGDPGSVEEGDTVRRTGRVLSVPVGDALLGRVVDALGRPLDGKGDLDESKIADRRNVEIQAPGVIERQPVEEPLETGIKAIDSMIPIGRGQRELIIGDRQTGKTAVAIDAIINQRRFWGTDRAVKCIYVAIGQKGSDVAAVVEHLEEESALEYTVVVNASASVPAPYLYLAPYAGCAMGNHWMYNGEHSLIVYDDLSKQADAYRQISLLLRRPPGREAYPGDVFYLHSRLLERAAKLSDDLGAGSLTALPIIETKAGDISAYIPTNVISITDGQIYLEKELFNEGVRPAINAGRSVSRVGGDAQTAAMKDIAGSLRLDLSQYREMEAFSEFGSELDEASQRQLARGERIVEVLKQPQYEPVPMGEQVVSVWAATNGKLDDLPVDDIKRFEQELRDFMRSRHSDLLDRLGGDADLDEIGDDLEQAVNSFKEQFEPSEEIEPPGGDQEEEEGSEEAEASAEEEEETEASAEEEEEAEASTSEESGEAEEQKSGE
ncbi:MAG: F0F1 ATP synthase subunit alpha [Actinomycetota bacterium]|nr:F0F1 ATP synthase subunit alpha [Actinomycetota bacterium]